jgi:outer membrane protein OmpA-like peptidoglycan-associated protein
VKSFVNEIHLTPCKEGDNFVMDKIYFYPNSPDMKPGSKSELDKLVTYLKENPTVCIEIQGHTNGNKRIKKSYGGNFNGSAKKLSQCRADVIKKYLVEKGISLERLIANGYGGSRMIFPNPKTQEQANKNIRVEILLLPEKQPSRRKKI